MPNKIYYPDLFRKKESDYYCQTGGFYAASNYQNNYPKIAEDCKHRCVYCDATIRECGGEPFSLDHFRPQNIFANKFNGILINSPFNLHLSCQKCNVLKSNDWKGCTKTINGPTFINGKGYIDRFNNNILEFITLNNDGRLFPTTYKQGPGKYMINRLHLNRPNRVYLRKKRAVNKLIKDIEITISQCTDLVINKYKGGTNNLSQGMLDIEKIQNINHKFIIFKGLQT